MANWNPPEFIPREQCIKDTEEVLGLPDIPITSSEDIFRINVLGMDWDLGMVVHQPVDAGKIPTGADGKKIGFFLLHGGSSDFKGIERHAKLLASKYGCRVMAGTFPGRFYFPDPSRDWPDDTIHADGTVRTPIWKQGELIAPDQYDVVKDPSKRNRYGTRTLAKARPETNFWYRMAAWPAAFEEGMIEACKRHFPIGEFSIYGQGHSTGGPFICMLSQRIPNMAGVCATENSPFGYLCSGRDVWGGELGKITGYDKPQKQGKPRSDPFDELYIRTWRDLARYQGPEALGQEGPQRADALAGDHGRRARCLGASQKSPTVQSRVSRHPCDHRLVSRRRESQRGEIENEQRRNRCAGATIHRLHAGTIRSKRQTATALPVRNLERQPRPQPGSLQRSHHPRLPRHEARPQNRHHPLRRRRA